MRVQLPALQASWLFAWVPWSGPLACEAALPLPNSTHPPLAGTLPGQSEVQLFWFEVSAYFVSQPQP